MIYIAQRGRKLGTELTHIYLQTVLDGTDETKFLHELVRLTHPPLQECSDRFASANVGGAASNPRHDGHLDSALQIRTAGPKRLEAPMKTPRGARCFGVVKRVYNNTLQSEKSQALRAST